MKLAIADPPYLGRAALWYGGKGRGKQGTVGRAAGRGCLTPEFHPAAHEWDSLAPSRSAVPISGARVLPEQAMAQPSNSTSSTTISSMCLAGLSAAHPVSGFVGSKPSAWTHWVLDLLGFQPGDEVTDVFPGSGAVERAAGVLL